MLSLATRTGLRATVRAATLRGRRLSSTSLGSQLDEHGFAVARAEVGSSLLADINRHFPWLRSTYPEIPAEHLHSPLLRHDALWMHIATHPDILSLVTPILGPDVALFASHYVCKEPRVGLEVLPHQDVWPLEPMEVVSVFVAVDECSSRNGGLQVLPRSHLPGLQAHRKAAGDNVFGASLAAGFADALSLDLAPGDVVLLHGNTVHASAANTSELRRCALTLRYIPVSTRVTNQARSTSYCWMAAGEPLPGTNSYHSWPLFIPGYHPEFPGCERWNERRRVHAEDEQNFAAEAPEALIEAGERRAREDVANVIETLAKGKRRAIKGGGG